MRVRSFLLFLVFVLAGPVVAQTRTYDKYIDSWGDTRFRGPYAGDLTAAQARGSALWDKAVNLDGGMPRVAADASFRNPSGNAVPATATTRLPPAEVSKAVGRSLARIALKVAVPLSVGMELFDLGKELGFDLGRSSTGELTVAKPNPAVCSVAPCYGFPHRTLGIVSSLAAACQSYVGTYQYGDLVQSLRDVLPPSSCGWVMGWGYYQPRNIGLVDVAPAPAAAPLPSTQQEFVDAVAAKSGWPSTSAIDRVIKADVQAGSVPLTGPISVTGPATSPGTSSQTTNTTNNNVTTTTTTHNHTYEGAKVTTTNTVVTSVYSPTTNTTTTETTTGSPPVAPTDPEKPDYTSSDTPLPDQPVLYERKYPTGLVGVWAQKKADLVATPLIGVVSSLMPSVGSGGSCPAWNLNLNLGTWNYGAHNVAPPCYIWEWAKFFVIAGALLLARALIFGG